MRRNTSSGCGRTIRLQEIADYCGLSRITVSCALRGDRKNVSQQTMKRVLAAARKLGYDPAQAHAARRLRYQHAPGQVVNHLAAVFFPYTNIHERYWALILEGIQDGFLASRFGVLSCAVRPDAGNICEQLPMLFHRGDVDGAVIFATENYRDNLIAALREDPGFGERPIVTLPETFPGCSSVVVNDFEAGRLAAGHLLDLGHRHLMNFASRRFQSPITEQRLAGHRRAYEERGLDPSRWLHTVGFLWEPDPGLRPALEAALTKFPMVTGILCPNDLLGLQIVPLLRQLGRRVPYDISLVGVDDIEALSDAAGENTWTTVRLPLRDLGRTAAETLLALVGDDAGKSESRVLPVELVVRGSTRPPRQG